MGATRVYEIADGYVAAFAALDPTTASAVGIDDHGTRLTDHSPEAIGAREDLVRATLRDLAAATPTGDRDRLAAAYLEERLRTGLALSELGESFRAMNVLGGPLQDTRQVFDLMDRDTVEDWERIAARLTAVPASIESALRTLDVGVASGLVVARRQALGVRSQLAAWSGADGSRPFFAAYVAPGLAGGTTPPALRNRLERAAEAATRSLADAVDHLDRSYLPHTTEQDAVGPDRYAAWARYFNGTDLDLVATYEWGWHELRRIETAMRAVCDRILPGGSIDATMAHLDRDPALAVEGEDAFRAWLQDLLDRSVADLDGAHFDIPPPVRRVEAMLAPPGGGASMYYTPPSEDFSRPGRTWYPTQGQTRFPIWGEVSTCYHEGVPGHHLQCALLTHLGDTLTRFQRTIGWNSGHGEGWALYAERLMGELGYLDEPAYELGMLRAHALRAVRVVIDIGMHLRLRVPEDEPDIGGSVWTPDLGLQFAFDRARLPDHLVRFEIDRYLGLPGQAISYKIGERVWLEARADARRRHGADFDLRAWHAFALDLGPLGLDLLATELGRF